MRILHFSDFHLAKDGIEQSKILISRIIYAIKQSPMFTPIDAIVFTGDMIDKGGLSFDNAEEAYTKFHEIVVEELCEKLGVDESMFFAVPGNHEVNRNSTDKELDIKLESSLLSSESIHNYLISAENKGFNERLKDYDSYYRKPWLSRCGYKPHTSVELSDHFIISADGRQIGISLLNSAWRCGKKLNRNEKRPNKGIVDILKRLFRVKKDKQTEPEIIEDRVYENRTLVGAAQITNADPFFKDNLIKNKIGLLHHHYSLLGEPDDDDIEKALQKNYTICFCGHKHRPKSEKTEEDDEIIIATAPGVIRWNTMSNGRNKNGFSIWNIDFSNEKASEIQFIQKDGQDFEPLVRDGGFIERIWNWNLKRHLQDFHKFFENRRVALIKDISCHSLEVLCDQLKSDRNNTLVLYGLPGLGKTHLIHKAFDQYKSEKIFSQISITETQEKITYQLRKELQSFFRDYDGKEACIIIDNTDVSAFLEIKRLRDESYSDVKLIGIMNHCDFHKLNRYSIPTLELKTEFTREAIDIYVDQRLSDIGMRETVKAISDGFPFVAIKVVEKLLKTETTSKKDASDILMHSTYVIDEELQSDSDVYEMLCAMALFKPFPKLEKDSMSIWQSKHMSGLYNKTHAEIVQLIDKTKQLWHGEIVESSESGYSIRPYLVANWLAESWFEKHGKPETFIGLLNDITSLPENEKRITISCLKQRLSDMNDCAAAKELLKKLTSTGGVFRCEDVVFSELGSQLVLAMSNVNPLEVSDALREIIVGVSSERIKTLHYMVRRNIVFALANAIFYDAAFETSIEALGTLALNETDDTISNNSKGIFTSVFQILLSGTQASLERRVNWLQSVHQEGNPLSGLVPIAIQRALAAGSFLHTGHMGPKNSIQKDYQPSNEDVRFYWCECCKIAMNDIESGRYTEIYRETVDSNLKLWAHSGIVRWVLPLIQEMANSDKTDWSMLESDFNDIVNELKSKDREAYTSIEKLRNKIVRTDFFSRLKSRQKDFYSLKRMVTNHDEEIHFFDVLTNEFIDNKEYQNAALINQLLTSIEFVSWAFCTNLSARISDDLLTELYNVILENQNLTDDIRSPFLFTFCSMTRDRIPTQNFIGGILDKGKFSLYTKLMARTEDDNISHLSIILSKVGNEYDCLPDYLNNVSLTSMSRDKLVKYIDNNFYDIENKDEAVHFVVTHCSYDNLLEATLAQCKSILLRYFPDDNSAWVMRDILHFATNLLEQCDDVDFALAYHKHILGFKGEHIDTYGLAEYYKLVLTKYPDKILEPLLLSMADCDYDSAARTMVQELGTGMGFGIGILFSIDKNLLMEQLTKHGLPMARLYAQMCPIFGEGDIFSDWVDVLLEQFGADEYVLSNLSCNMGSYAWSGSVVGLHKRKIAAFSMLLSHPISKVCEWANASMKQEKEWLNQEILREDLMHQLYK